MIDVSRSTLQEASQASFHVSNVLRDALIESTKLQVSLEHKPFGLLLAESFRVLLYHM